MKRKKLLSALLACTMLLGTAFHIGYTVQKESAETAAAADYANETLEAYAYQVAAIVNKERAAYGLQPLQYSDTLSNAAIVRAQEIQSVFSHTRPNGSSCFTALTERGITYRYAGENIAYGQRTPEEVMQAWMNSEGHRANILSTNVTYIGIGVTQRGGVYYWSQFFAASDMLTGSVITDDATPAQTTAASVATTAATTRRTTTAASTTTQRVTTTRPTATTATVTTAAVTTAAPASTAPTVTTAVTEGGDCSGISPDVLKALLEKISSTLGIDIRAMIDKR